MRKLCVFLALAILLAGALPVGAQSVAPGELVGGTALAEAFTAATGYAPDPAYFGVYVIEPVGGALYLGLGTARPAEYDGALLARYDGNGLTPLAALDEQGFVDMTAAGGKLYIPGADPLEDWSLGNLHIHDLATGETVKRRTLPNTIHAWQVRKEADGRLLVTVGRYLPEQGAWPYAGGILASSDEGLTWTVADADGALGIHRTYDLVAGPAQAVALADDADIGGGCQLATRAAGGAWTRGPLWTICRQRLASDPTGRRVLAVGADARSLVVAGNSRAVPLPFEVERWAYHWSALVGRTLYVLASDGRVMATDDLRTWREVAAFAQPLVSIAYWPARGALVVATRGTAAGLYVVPLSP